MSFRRNALVLFSAAALVACSNDDNNTESQPDVANVVDGGSDANAPDTKVVDAHDSTVDTGVVDSTTETIADSAPESTADVVDTADTADAALCPTGRWFDFEGGACADCPETPRTLSCSDFFFPGSSWDPTTSTIDIQLNVSIAEMVSGTVDYTIIHASGASDSHTVTATFSGNDMKAVLTVPADAVEIDVTAESVTDACGTASTPAVQVTITPLTDGGTPDHAVFGCPA